LDLAQTILTSGEVIHDFSNFFISERAEDIVVQCVDVWVEEERDLVLPFLEMSVAAQEVHKTPVAFQSLGKFGEVEKNMPLNLLVLGNGCSGNV
jgi:hypothetical protein